MNESIIYEGDCRTAPATPGLLITPSAIFFAYMFSDVIIINRPGVAGAVLQTPS